MKGFLFAAAALSAALSYGDRVEKAALNDIPPDQPSVVTNVDLLGFVTNVDGKLDRKYFWWNGTNWVYGAGYAEKARSALSADLATRALAADNVNAAKMKNIDTMFDNIATNKNPAATAAFSNAVSAVSVDGSAEAAAMAELLSGRITQSRKTLLISNIVEYIMKKERIRTEE